jgi:hypothetical protein
MTPYRRLALAVLEAAYRDAHAGCPDARKFLAEPTPLLELWCAWLAIQPQTTGRLLRPSEAWDRRIKRAKVALMLPRHRPP